MKSYLVLAVLFLCCSVVSAQSVQQQVDACGQLTVCKLDVPSGVTVVNKAWNLRDKTALSIKGLAGAIVIFQFDADPPPAVCLDTTGARKVSIEDVTFALGNTSKRPDVLWLHGRGADGKSQERLSVSNSGFQGWFNKATVVFTSVENEGMHSVDFENGVANTTALFLSRQNELGVVSPFGPIRVDSPALMMTSTNHVYVNCSFNHEGHVGLIAPANNDQGFGITLGSGVHDLLIQGGSTSGGSRGGVLRIMGQDNRRIAVVSPNWESKNAKACIVIDGFIYGLSVRDGLLMAEGPALRLNGTAENLSFRPAEMLTTSILKFGPLGKLSGRGLTSEGLAGQ